MHLFFSSRLPKANTPPARHFHCGVESGIGMTNVFASLLSRSSPKALETLLLLPKSPPLYSKLKPLPRTLKTSIFSRMSQSSISPNPPSNSADADRQIGRFSLSASSLLVIQKGDITKWSVDGTADAIVNAANERMLGGGGVDGAIHRAAGPELVAACKDVPEVHPGVRCPTGEARITPAFRLPVSHVIHTVGPIYDTDSHPEASLQNAYRNSLSVAKDNSIQYIAFPAISCGVYGYPFKDASRVAISTVKEFSNDFKEVHFVLFSDDIYKVWLETADELL